MSRPIRSRRVAHGPGAARVAGSILLFVAAASPALEPDEAVSVGPGLTWVLEKTTSVRHLQLAPGAAVSPPAGCCVTLTINGVETGLRPGTYDGPLTLTVTAPNDVKFLDNSIWQFRQALYLDASGIVSNKSALAAAGSPTLSGSVLSGIDIHGHGENFNGVFAGGGRYTLKDPVIDLTGNGGNDFAGYGAALMASGAGTTLTVEGAKITTRGATRSAVVADKGAHLVVKHSTIQAFDGDLPADYVPNTALGTMKNVPWMLGLVGDNRATNLLGDNSMATYIQSDVAAERWGVLSVDMSNYTHVTAIDSQIHISGSSGYGTYAIGDSTNAFYGSQVRVPDYGAIVTGGHLILAASTPEHLGRLNRELDLGLSAQELASIPRLASSIVSDRFGVMIWGNALIEVGDDTTINSGESTFLVKSANADIRIDGAGGARLEPGNGVLLQLMDTDNPGPVVTSGRRLATGVYHEPSSTDARVTGFDVTSTAPPGVTITFSRMTLRGDLFNGSRSDGVSFPGGPKPPPGRNLVVNLRHAQLTGQITASRTRHALSTITPLDYRQLGEVSNTPQPAVNNGVIVTLDNSSWVVTHTSYLTSLTLSGSSRLSGPGGAALRLSIDGKPASIHRGTVSGQIVLEPAPR